MNRVRVPNNSFSLGFMFCFYSGMPKGFKTRGDDLLNFLIKRKRGDMASTGIEPATFALLARRSNQLS